MKEAITMNAPSCPTSMKLGFGLYRHQLTTDFFRFARQCGATHLVVHLVDYFNTSGRAVHAGNQPVGDEGGWGHAGDPHDPIWSAESLQRLVNAAAAEGLAIAAVENLDPSMWYDILLGGPRKAEQMALVQQVIRNLGRAGIPVFGYNFSIAGVAGRQERPVGRGRAVTVVVDGVEETPIPHGMVWNMRYDDNPPRGHLEFFEHDELWRRLAWFLENLLPVAEEAGVRLAAHPDDPPMAIVRNTPRLVYQPHMYQRLLDLAPSRSNALEFCVGTLAEMTEGDIYDVTDRYSRSGSIGYVHLRNVRGKVPHYEETFIDEGDVDVLRILRILQKNNFDGVVVPDHTPLMTCAAPWHAGMAYAMGFIAAAMKIVSTSPV